MIRFERNAHSPCPQDSHCRTTVVTKRFTIARASDHSNVRVMHGKTEAQDQRTTLGAARVALDGDNLRARRSNF
jgi:hypothetical protein